MLMLVVVAILVVLALLLLLLLALLLLLLLLLLADEAFGLLTLPPASGRGNDEDVKGEEEGACEIAIEARSEDAPLMARRSDLNVCVLVPLVPGVKSLLL